MVRLIGLGPASAIDARMLNGRRHAVRSNPNFMLQRLKEQEKRMLTLGYERIKAF
jgi:hypothetical protein